jgi:hypothetical protein
MRHHHVSKSSWALAILFAWAGLAAPAGETTVAVNIIDMLGEEVLVTSPPDG